MAKTIAYSKQSSQFLRRIPKNEANRIIAKIRGYVENPDSMRSNVKALKGLGLKRLRIGEGRVIFDESGNVLTIVKIGARGSVYD